MNEAKGFSIRAKLLIGFSIILALFLTMLGIVFANLYENRAYSQDVVAVYIPVEHATVDLNSLVTDMNRAYSKWLLTRDIRYKSDIVDIMSSIKVLEDQISSKMYAFSDAEKASWNDITANIA